MRFILLKEVQTMLAPPKVLSLLGFRKVSWVRPVLSLYKLSRYAKMDALFKSLLLPEKYKPQIKQLDINLVAV